MTDTKKPAWLRVRLPSTGAWARVEDSLARYRLHTVCDEARCPNKGECWGQGTATFMIMGDLCTRSCRFCAVGTSREGRPLDRGEGEALARCARELGLRYVVLTSVDRDDLPDRGAGHFAACVGALKGEAAGGADAPALVQVEALTPDYTSRELEGIIRAGVDVLAHNVETVRSLQGVRDARAGFDRSLATLRAAKALGAPLTKSSLLLGLGETEDEVLAAMDELRGAGVDILVMGQYLQPSPRQVPVAAYVPPEQFERYAGEARRRGFASVVSAPLARTSYHARHTAGLARGGAGREDDSREPR